MEYQLTPLGRSLLEPLQILADWARAHGDKIEQARDEFDHDNSTDT